MSNKQQTAVETIIKYCEEKLRTDVNSHRGAYTNVINFCKTQAKAIEKEQIENAWCDGNDCISFNAKINAEQYYNETYRGDTIQK
jgi:hypothetical protein